MEYASDNNPIPPNEKDFQHISLASYFQQKSFEQKTSIFAFHIQRGKKFNSYTIKKITLPYALAAVCKLHRLFVLPARFYASNTEKSYLYVEKRRKFSSTEDGSKFNTIKGKTGWRIFISTIFFYSVIRAIIAIRFECFSQ